MYHTKTTWPVSLFVLLVMMLQACSKSDNGGSSNPPNTLLPDTLGAGWSKQTVSPFHESSDIFFTNSSAGFLVADNRIYKTADGGASWQKVYTAKYNFFNIAMSSSTHGLFANMLGKRIYVTRDGGNSFDSVAVNDPQIYDVVCINSNLAYAIGQYFWTTTDGGSTWTQGTNFGQYGFALQFINSTTGWAVGNFGILKTTDSGQTWQALPVQPNSALHGLYFLDANKGYVKGPGGVFKTVTGGSSWTTLLATSYYNDLHFLTENIGYMTDGRFILKTTDGGMSWQKEVRLGQGLFLELHFTDAAHGWAAADDGTVIRFQ